MEQDRDSRACVRRKSDGKFYCGNYQDKLSDTPKFVSSVAEAKRKVIINLGIDLDSVEILTAKQIRDEAAPLSAQDNGEGK